MRRCAGSSGPPGPFLEVYLRKSTNNLQYWNIAVRKDGEVVHLKHARVVGFALGLNAAAKDLADPQWVSSHVVHHKHEERITYNSKKVLVGRERAQRDIVWMPRDTHTSLHRS